MEQFSNMLSFAWIGTKKGRFTRDKWGDAKNCRPLSTSSSKANAILTGHKQLDPTKQYKLVALDLDKKDNWQEVGDKWKQMGLPRTFTTRTPNGGLHMFYWVPKNAPAKTINDDTHCRNFEVKGDNSNITAPQSVFECGSEYEVVLDTNIAKLDIIQAFTLFKHKPKESVPTQYWMNEVDLSDVERKAYELDHQARKNPRGYTLKCPFHEDKRASAILFENGYFYCSGCGHEEFLVDKKIDFKI